MTTTISISGKETKVHIREALKAVFPGIKFGLTSSYDSVNLSWTDGPLVPDVQRVLNRFTSYSYVLAHTDGTQATGYEWKGERYVGARYLNTQRKLSDERRAALVSKMESAGENYNDALIPLRLKAERELIASGTLTGHPPADRPDLLLDERPTIDRRQRKKESAAGQQGTQSINNVVPFKPKAADPQPLNEIYSPEQRLKLHMLKLMNLVNDSDGPLTPEIVELAFSALANEMFGTKGVKH